MTSSKTLLGLAVTSAMITAAPAMAATTTTKPAPAAAAHVANNTKKAAKPAHKKQAKPKAGSQTN